MNASPSRSLRFASIFIATLLGATLGARASRAQCGTGPMIVLDPSASYAYEGPTPVSLPYLSSATNQLTVVGRVASFCAPLDDFNAADPDTEYTIVMSGMVSLGTTQGGVGQSTFYTTTYLGGTFAIYQHSPRLAYNSAAQMPGSPPNSTVPSIYQSGTVLLSGGLSGFTIQVTRTGQGPAVGSYSAQFVFTGGTLIGRMQSDAASLLTGSLCVTGCLPPAGGYSGQLGGSFNFALSIDTDGDGVPDGLDLCPTVSAAGQDADGNGCVDPTSTMHHVETWATSWLPIHVALPASGMPGITDGSDLAALRAAMQTWRNVPDAQVQMVEDTPTSQISADPMDGVNLVTFRDSSYPFSPSVLAVTPTLTFTKRATYRGRIVLPGQILDADMLFNPAASFSTPTHPGDYDLQSVATHEFGHMLGLVHSGVRTATMFFIQQPGTVASTLKNDDMAAIAAAYPGPNLLTSYGTIRGHVVSGLNGQPVPGALVTAVRLNLEGFTLEDTVASDYTREDGSYALFRLPTALYGVHIQALDGTVLDGLTADFISQRLANIAQTGFDPKWYSVPQTNSNDPNAILPLNIQAGTALTGIDIITNVDTTPPTVTAVTPADGSTGVGIDAVIAIAFSKAVDPTTIPTALQIHKDGQTTRLTGSGVLTNFGRTLLFTPDLLLDYAALYDITLTTALADAHGNALAAPFNASFTTGPEPAASLSAVFPTTVPTGGIVTLDGVGFISSDIVQVHFTSSGPEQIATASSVSPGTIVAQVPAGVTPGADGVYFVVQGGGTSNSVPLTVVTPPSQSIPAATGTPIPLPFTPSGVALANDGAMAYVVGGGGFATISLDPTSNTYRTPVTHFTTAAERSRLTPDGLRLLISQPLQNQVLIVNADRTSGALGAVLDTIPLAASPGDFAIDATGQFAYIANPSNSVVWVADLRTSQPSLGQVIRTLTLTAPLAGGVALTPGAGGLVLDGSSGMLSLPAVGGTASSLTTTNTTGPVAVDPAGVQVFAPAASGALATSSSNGAYLPAVISTGGLVRDVVMSRFGQSAYVVNGALNQLQVVNSVPGSTTFRTLVGQVPTGTGPVAGAISSNGALLAVANAGSPSLSLYATGEGGAPILGAIVPPIALSGDQVAARSGTGALTGLAGAAVDLGGTLLAATHSVNEGLGFVVPSLSQRMTSVTAQLTNGARSLALPFEIVDPILALSARPSGRTLSPSPAPCTSTGETGAITLMRDSPDGHLLAVLKTPSTCPNNIDLFEMSDGGLHGFGVLDGTLQLPGGTSASDFSFTADGSQIWVAMRNNTLHVFDANPMSTTFTQELGAVTAGIAGAPRSVGADPLGRRVIVGGAGIRFFRPDLSLEKTLSGSTLAGAGIAISPDGHRAALGAAGRAYFVDVDRETLVSISPPHGGAGGNNVDRIAITTDGSRALGLFADGSVSVWTIDPRLGALGTETYHGTPVGPGVRLSTPVPGVDGHSVLCGDALGTDFVRLDLTTATPSVALVPTLAAARVVQRSTDGRRLFAANSSGTPVIAGLSYYSLSSATQMALVSGANQTGAPGNPLPLPVAVRVADGTGQPQAGVVVRFDLGSAANGSLPGTTGTRLELVTDATGQAQTPWVMPASGTSAMMSISALGVTGATLSLAANIAVDSKLVPPVVVQFGPPNGSSGVNAGSSFSVQFNQAMSMSSLNTHFAMTANGNPVPGALTLQNLGMLAVFTPASPPPYSANCTITVHAGASDTDGQVTSTDASSAFTIQGPPTVAITSLSPPSGPAGASITINGTGFSPTLLTNLVSFTGGSGIVTNGNLSSLVATVPAYAASGPLTVQVGATTSNALTFNVLSSGTKQSPGNLGSGSSNPGIRDIAVTPDGTRLYITDPAANSLVVFDVQTVTQIAQIAVGIQPQAVVIVPDGSRAYVANTGSNNLSVVDINPSSSTYNTVIQTIPVGSAPIGLDLLPIGPSVYVLNQGSGTVQVIDARPGDATFNQVTTTVNVGSGATAIKIKPDGSTMFVTNSVGFEVVDLKSGQTTNQVSLGSPGIAIDVTPDGSLALVLTQNGDLKAIVLTAGTQQYQVVTTVNTGSGATSIKISPDGSTAYVTNGDGNTVLVFSIGITTSSGVSTTPPKIVTLTLIATIPVGQYPTALVFDPSGRPLGFVVNNASGTITLIGSPSGLPPAPVLLEVNACDIDLKSECRWVPALIQPSAPYTASQIVLGSILLNGVPPDTTGPHAVGDANHDGIPDLLVSFPRKDLLKTLPPTEPMIVTATGSFADTRRFMGRDTLKLRRGDVECPTAGMNLTPGSTVQLCWSTPPNTSVQWVAVLHSFDHGECWELDGDLQPNTGSYAWQVPDVSSDSVLVAVELIESSQPAPAGSDTPALMSAGTVAMSSYFGVSGTTAVQDAPTTLTFARPHPNPAFGQVALRFGLPQRTHVKLDVFDIMGRRVRSLADGTRAPGWYELSWDGGLDSGQKAAAGLYFVRFEAMGRVFRARLSWLH